MPENWRLFLHPKYQKLKNLFYTLTYSLVRIIRPVRPDSVILATNRTRTLTDNLRYVYDRIDRERYSVRVFFLSNPAASTRHRLASDMRFVAAMAQTQYTIVDDFLPLIYPIRLRPGTRLVQVWHALGALKRVGYSREGKNGGPPRTSISHKNYTDVIVSAESIRKDFAEAFGVSIDKVHATGAPRSDLFFDLPEQETVRSMVYAAYPALRDKRVVLFAPTFRGRGKRTAYYPTSYLDLERLGAALGPSDVLVLKMHPFVKDQVSIPSSLADRVLDLSDYPEFNHLLLVCDLLVTDYSSAIFDYALLKRPIIFYVPDLDDYTRNRGFYYDFSEYVYGPVARSLDELVGLLGTATIDKSRLSVFYEKFLGACDGHATQRFLTTIFGDPSSAVSHSQTVGRDDVQ